MELEPARETLSFQESVPGAVHSQALTKFHQLPGSGLIASVLSLALHHTS